MGDRRRRRRHTHPRVRALASLTCLSLVAGLLAAAPAGAAPPDADLAPAAGRAAPRDAGRRHPGRPGADPGGQGQRRFLHRFRRSRGPRRCLVHPRLGGSWRRGRQGAAGHRRHQPGRSPQTAGRRAGQLHQLLDLQHHPGPQRQHGARSAGGRAGRGGGHSGPSDLRDPGTDHRYRRAADQCRRVGHRPDQRRRRLVDPRRPRRGHRGRQHRHRGQFSASGACRAVPGQQRRRDQPRLQLVRPVPGVCRRVPCDNNNHGTHTMGTMVGGDGGANNIGVAPGARWIAAKGCESNSCSDRALLESGQWMLAPTRLDGSGADPARRPQIINNSWGGPGGNSWYSQTIDAWRAAGIFPAFSGGNSGPSCGSAGSPGDDEQAFASGSFDINNVIASTSGRGAAAARRSPTWPRRE